MSLRLHHCAARRASAFWPTTLWPGKIRRAPHPSDRTTERREDLLNTLPGVNNNRKPITHTSDWVSLSALHMPVATAVHNLRRPLQQHATPCPALRTLPRDNL